MTELEKKIMTDLKIDIKTLEEKISNEFNTKFGNDMTEFEKEMWKDVIWFDQDKETYKKKVDGLSKEFGVYDDPQYRFQNDYLPTYIVGNYTDDKEKYVVVSLNPGIQEELTDAEEKIKRGSVDNYQNFILNFFKLISKINSEVKSEVKNADYSYYNNFRPYFGTLLNKEITKDTQ